MIQDNSVDAVVSNCVLNLVDANEKEQLFQEIFRVLRPGGRAVISDIMSDELAPQHMRDDPELWSGCISGAFQESDFLQAFERAGFHGIEMPILQKAPWQIVEDIEFRSATVIAYKGKQGPCDDYHEAGIYKGPFSMARDDDGHEYQRGERTAVCRKTFKIMTRAPYTNHFVPVLPYATVADEDAEPMSCGGELRSPRTTKGEDYNLTASGDECCGSENCC